MGTSHSIKYHPARFCGHRHCGGGDIWLTNCQVTSQDHMIKGSHDFRRTTSRKCTILTSLVAIGTIAVDIY